MSRTSPPQFYCGKRIQLPIYATRTFALPAVIKATIHSSVPIGSAPAVISGHPSTRQPTVLPGRKTSNLKHSFETKKALYPFLPQKPRKKVRFDLPICPQDQRAHRTTPLPLLPRHPNALTPKNIEHACALGTIAYRRFCIQQLIVHLRGALFESSLHQLPEFQSPTGSLCWTLKTPRTQLVNKKKWQTEWLTEDWFQVKVTILRHSIEFFHIISPSEVRFLVSLPK